MHFFWDALYDSLCFQFLKLTLGVLKVPLFLEDGHDGDKAEVDQQEGSGQEQLQPPWKYHGQYTTISIRDYKEIIKNDPPRPPSLSTSRFFCVNLILD